jgi:hypothetical protein
MNNKITKIFQKGKKSYWSMRRKTWSQFKKKTHFQHILTKKLENTLINLSIASNNSETQLKNLKST